MTEPSDRAARPGWLRRNAMLLAGVLLVVVGVITTVLGSGLAPVAIGHFAYAPLTEAALVVWPPLWEDPFLLGLVITVIGLMLIAAGLGYRAGRKRGATP